MAKQTPRTPRTRASTKKTSEAPSGGLVRKSSFDDSHITFGKVNYLLMVIGVLIIFLGFLVMSMETATHGFGDLALVVAPVLLVIGFVLEFFAIFYKKKDTADTAE